jgi:Catalytic LigB subunit of aromatic ring-opening dioxygenase
LHFTRFAFIKRGKQADFLGTKREIGDNMSQIIKAIGVAHGPMLALPPELWVVRAQDEMSDANFRFNRLDGRYQSYSELLAEIGDKYGHLNNLELYRQKHAQAQATSAKVADAIEEARPDVVIIIGNDQDELFRAHNAPALGIFYGEEIKTFKRTRGTMPEWRWIVSQAYGMDDVYTYPGAPDLGLGLVKGLVAREFDIAAASHVEDPTKLGFGHAYGYVIKNLYKGRSIPTLPVFINTYCPPNLPTPKRCLDFGRAIADVIAKRPDDERIVVIASGGLSHFLCEEAFDRDIMQAMIDRNFDYLASIPEPALNSGSGEIRSWITLAGMLDGLSHEWSDYIPVHRTPPGTGMGLGFGVWG